MDKMDRDLAKEIAGEDKALIIGDVIMYPPMVVGDKSFHFNALQVRFLSAVQRYKGDLEKACQEVVQPTEWARKFIGSRKFRAFRNAKLAAASARNGDLADWWWETGLAGAKGVREWYEGQCSSCHEDNVFTTAEAEMMRDDDMKIKATCKICFQDIQVERKEEEFKPSREQVQFWSELGNRLAPKIERVQHQFSEEKFVFVEGAE